MSGIKDYTTVGGWGLTEKLRGSDASGMLSTCKRLDNNTWELNGNKRWIGNANRDMMVVFARNVDTKKINGFILKLDDNTPGLKRELIQRKMALRGVHNMQLYFDKVKIPESMRLEKVKDFKDVADMLAHSRQYVGWLAVAIGVGIYDHVIRYVREREQFGKPLAKYQLIQEKLVKIMGNVQACLHLMAKITELYEQGKSTIGKFAMAKSWVTLKIREAAALGREILGGNGIILDNYVMKAFIDIEAIYTYEGTYDINALVAGRELTGHAAFK